MLKSAVYLLKVIFSVFLLSIVIFYYWASSPRNKEAEYKRIIRFANPEKHMMDTLSIITFNIGYLSGLNNNLPISTPFYQTMANLDSTICLINSISPQIIGFQEIDYGSKRSGFINQFDSIGENCGFSYGSMAINWDKKYVPFPYWPPAVHFGRIYSGQGILSVYRIIENELVVFPKPASNPFYYNKFYLDRLLQVSTLMLRDSSKLLVLNVHFEAFNKSTREIESNLLAGYLQSIPPDQPYILIGDFNSRPPFLNVTENEESTIRNILKMGLESAVSEAPYIRNPSAFNTFRSDNPVEMIDYIFYDSGLITKIDAFVIKGTGLISDHLPVYMKFTIKN